MSFQDFEEQLDQKDRLIKKLQNQIKSLETSQKGKVLACVCELSDKSNMSMLITSLFVKQPSKRLHLLFPKIISACWSIRERMNPSSFKTSFWVFVLFTNSVTFKLYILSLFAFLPVLLQHRSLTFRTV